MFPKIFAGFGRRIAAPAPIAPPAPIEVAIPNEPARLRRLRLTYVAMASGFLVAEYVDDTWKYTSHPNMRFATPFTSPKEAHRHGNRAAPMLHGFENSYYTLVQPV